MPNQKKINDKIKLKLRSTAVAVRGNKILIYQTRGSDYWSLPGGKVEPDEDSRQTLVREMKEEAGVRINIKRLLLLSENFFSRPSGTRIHEVAFYYLVDIDRPGEFAFEGREGDDILLDFRWVEREQLGNFNLKPDFLREVICQLPTEPQHLITHNPDRTHSRS